MSFNRPEQPKNQTIAAIDLGSNSFHLSVVRVVNGTLQPLVTDKRMVRLADELGADYMLSDAAMLRGLEVLESFAETIQELHSSSVRAVATHSLRRAKNRNAFIRLARKTMPVPIEIISGDEEARLIYQGVAHTTHLEGRRLVVDIGGGSTELAIGEQFNILQLSSQPMGCVTYTKRYFNQGAISGEAFQAAEIAAAQRLEIIDRRFCNTGWDSALGCSGTVKAIAQFWQSHADHFDGVITSKIIETTHRSLIQAGNIEAIEGVDEHRRAVLPAGLAILKAVFKRLGVEAMTLSDSALREGVLYEMTDRMHHQDIRERTIDSLALRYDIDTAQAKRVQKTANTLLQASTSALTENEYISAQRILKWAIQLHEIGLHINRRAIQKHSSYIIDNTELPGFSREEQALLALLLMNYRKGFSRKNFDDFTLYKEDTAVLLAAILRLAILLNIRRLDDLAPNLRCTASKEHIDIRFPDNWLFENPVIHEDLLAEIKTLKARGIKLNIRRESVGSDPE